MIYWYGIKVGVRSLLKGKPTREALKSIIVPVNYWRTLEFRLVMDALQPRSGERILDIGSPKLLSLYLADVVGAEVYATDIEDYFLADYRSLREVQGIPEARYKISTADGRALPFPDGHFNKIYSVSVLEHIPDAGDSACVREIARTLAPGGVCVLTVPFAPVARDEFHSSGDFYWAGQSGASDSSTNVFFQRRYDEPALHARLVQPSGLRLKSMMYVGETFPLSSGKELAQYLPPATGAVQPFLSKVFLTPPTADWKSLAKPLCAVVVLTK